MTSRIPIYEPWVSAGQEENVLACLRENWISSRGRFVDSFERGLSDYTGISSVATCSNGTTALHLALLALDLRKGDEILVPSFAYVAAVNPITFVGATPRFVDIDPSTWNISPTDAERKVNKKTKAIICVHSYGVPCNMTALRSLADRHNLFLVEDCAEALGSFDRGHHVGTLGDICTFSFFGNKTITTGEGGAVASQNPDLISKVKRLKSQGVVKQGGYDHDIVAFNYRMTNVQAAIGVAQLAEIQTILKLKKQVSDLYRSELKPYVDFQVCDTSQCSNWLNTIKLSSIEQTKAVRKALERAKVEFRPGFPPVDKMPMYESEIDLGETNKLTGRLVCLPSHPSLTPDQQMRVISAISEELNLK